MKYIGLRAIVWLILGFWLIISVVAVSGMFRLWWQRERVLYLGKTVEQQREQVFQRAGLPSSVLSKVSKIEQQWPDKIHYQATGNQNILSYVTYLLIPRIPSGDFQYVLHAEGKRIVWCAEKNGAGIPAARSYNPPAPLALLLSLFFVAGIAELIRNIGFLRPNWPEAIALSIFGLTLFTLVGKGLFHSVAIPFFSATVLGIIGWIQATRNFLSGKNKTTHNDHGSPVLTGDHLFFTHQFWQKTLVVILAGLIALVLLWSALMSVIVVPDDWDAWAIWGAKAKVLALGSGPLFDVSWFGHRDYPLLWPVVWAFSGWCGGGWEEQWSRGWGTVFLALCLWELYFIVGQKTGEKIVGLLASALFVSMPMVPLLTSWSYAEAPLWLMMLCALASFVRWQESGQLIDVGIAGLFCAAAAYTKNEGVLFSFLLGCCFVISPGSRIKVAAVFFSVFLVCYAPWAYWVRIAHDLGSHATNGLILSKEAIHRATNRLPAAMEAIQRMWIDIRQWNIVGWGTGVAWVYLLLTPRTHGRVLLMFPAIMLLTFLLIILFHSAEIFWQMGTSWNRLTVQALPFFFVIIIPEVWQKVFFSTNKQVLESGNEWLR